MSPVSYQVCADPDCPEIVTGRYCDAHVRRGRAHRSPTTRAQDAEYRRKRAALLASAPPCHWCGAPATTADHEPPIAEGGTHDDMVPACKPCNDARGGRAAHRRDGLDPGGVGPAPTSASGAGAPGGSAQRCTGNGTLEAASTRLS